MGTIHIKRIYLPPSKKDGLRILVDRLWPRGLTKDKVVIDEWAKELAPTTELRKWFGHEPEKWKEFQKRYMNELKMNNATREFLKSHQNKKLITLLFAGADELHTHALILKEYLDKSFK
ncbi:MAG: DUF488 family protein [Chitinophagaceae bacterium]